MRICLPTEDERGLESRLCGHFGGAPYLTIVDTATERAEVIARGPDHEHGACVPAGFAATAGIDAVVCGGMGRRALAALAGTAVYLSAGGRVGEVLAELKAGRLPRLSAEEACAGGHHGCR
jgi:predicted Fe-Mo cluster-binding NifX family protein